MEISAQEREIRVGLAIEHDAPLRKWHERLLSELGQVSGVRLVQIELDSASRPPAFDNALASAIYRFDNLLTRRKQIETAPGWAGVTIPPDTDGTFKGVDIVIDLRSDPARPSAMAEAAGEVWSVDFLRGPTSPEGAGMRVAVTGQGAFPITLEVLEKGSFKRIDQAVCAGRRSAARNLEQAQQVVVAMILRTLRARVSGAYSRTILPCEDDLALPSVKGVASDRGTQPLLFAGNFVGYAAARSADNLSKKISAWSGTLAPHFRLFHGQGSPLDFSPGQSRALSKSRQHYLADPFLFRHEGKLWVFCEVFDYQTDTGAIAVAELTDEGLGPVQTVLSGATHLSYPYVFAHDREVYMMPETCARRRLEVWRAVKFPFEWELVSTALEGAVAVDSNLYNDGSRWWLFTNSTFDPSCDAGLELNIYEVDGPALKSLTPHAKNPVVADARYSRNGGRVFERDGRLYRPAQSLEYGQYGYGLYIMQVEKLDINDYIERPVRFIRGCHHLDCNGSDIIFDMRRGVSPKKAAVARSLA